MNETFGGSRRKTHASRYYYIPPRTNAIPTGIPLCRARRERRLVRLSRAEKSLCRGRAKNITSLTGAAKIGARLRNRMFSLTRAASE